MEKPKKSKPEIILFMGFIILSVCFLAMIWFFSEKSGELELKSSELKDRGLKLQQREIQLKKAEETESLLMSKICDSANKKQITEEVNALKSKANVEISKIVQSKSPIYIQVGSEATRVNLSKSNFIPKLKTLNYNVIDEYDLELNRADNSVRFFNKEDEQIAQQLCVDIKKQFSIELKIKYVKLPNIIVPKGQLEVWIK